MVKNILFKCIVSVCAIMALSKVAMASLASDYFRTKQSGNWNDVGAWESSADNSSWSDATLVPGTTASKIQIRNEHTLTVTTNITVDDVVVDAGGTVDVLSGITLTIANGVAPTDFGVSGSVRNAGTMTSIGTLIFHNNSIYQHTHTTTGGTIPFATWEDGSDCQIIGFTNITSHILLANSNYNFYNFTWNCPNQGIGSTPTLSHSIKVRNDFSIISTGLGLFRMIVSTATATSIIQNFNQTGGVYNLINSISEAYGSTLRVRGHFNISGGVFQKGTGLSVGKVVFNGTTRQNFSLTGGTISGPIEFIVNSNAIVDFENSIIPNTATGTFTIEDGATLITAHPEGLASTGGTGAIQSTGTRTFSPNANYIYNGTTAQQTGTGLPASVNNLTIDNSAGVALRSGNLTVNGSLNISNSYLDLGANALITTGAIGLSGGGTLRTQNTSANPLSVGKTWNGTVEYNGSIAQNIVGGQYSNLTLSGGIKALTGNLSISNDFDALGASAVNTGTYKVIYNGSGNQNVAGISYYDLDVIGAGTKTITAPATVGNNVNVSTGTLNANGNLTLLASASSNANIGPLSGSADVIGNVRIQSFLSGGVRGNKTMSTPIDDSAISGRKTFEQLKDFLIITGPGGGSNGFDSDPKNKNEATLKKYNESSSTFSSVPAIQTVATKGNGFLFYFRGNRINKDGNPGKLIAPFPVAEDVLVTYNGPINKKDIDILLTRNGNNNAMSGMFLAGNPYPSTIDWHEVRNSSTDLGSTTTIVLGGGRANAVYNAVGEESINGGSRYIQPGQGFYVQANVNGAVLRFRENQKNISNAPARLLNIKEHPILLSADGDKMATGKTVYQKNESKKLLKIAVERGDLTEETVAVFKTGFNEASDNDDSRYISGNEISIATLSSDGQSMAINLMPEAEQIQELKIFVNSNTSANQMKLSFKDISVADQRMLMLKDNYLNKLEVIDGNNKNYYFSIDKTKAESYGHTRFSVLFQPAEVLAVKLVDFSVKRHMSGAELVWTVDGQSEKEIFEIEHSIDGKVFESIGNVNTVQDYTGIKSYYFIDKDPKIGVNYYRIKLTNRDGSSSYSAIKTVDFSGKGYDVSEKLITIYPNPVNTEFSVDVKEVYNEDVVLNVFNLLGKKIRESKYIKNEHIVQDISDLPSGGYIIEIRSGLTKDVIGTAKIIKK